MALGRRARRRVGRSKRRAQGRRFFKRGPAFRGKRRFGTRTLLRRFRRRGRGGAELKIRQASIALPTIPVAMPTTFVTVFGMNLPIAVLGTRDGREGTKVRWKRYTWDFHFGGATTNTNIVQCLTVQMWEFVIWWHGDTIAIIANPDIIFENNGSGYLRLVSGFNLRQARNYKVLWSRKHRIGFMHDGVLADHMLPKIGQVQGGGFNNGAYQRLGFHTKGSINLLGKVSRYTDETVAEPIAGILVHYFVHGSNYNVIHPSYYGHERISFYDD